MSDPQTVEPLPWEDLSAQSAAGAFGESLGDLALHPRRFYSRVATSGGLHEPLMFFAILLGATVVLAFLAALAYFGLAAAPTQAGGAELLALQAADVRAYELQALPSRALTVMLVLLPEVLVAGAAFMIALGTLFHLGGKLFGADPWEGSVSVWLYSASAALVPLAVASLLIMVGSGVCHMAGMTGGGIPPSLSTGARVACSIGVAAGLILLIVHAVLGCIHTLRLDASSAGAATVAGLMMPVALITLCALGHWTPLGARSWLVGLGAVTVLTVVQVLRSRNLGTEEDQ